MALAIEYVLDPNTVSATLSRTIGRKMIPGEPVDDVVPLLMDETVYVYPDGVDGLTYGFKITATDSDGKSVDSNIFHMVYKNDFGPGKSNTITKGYFDFGVYETLTPAEFGMSPQAVRDLIASQGFPSMGVGYTTGITGWHKCLVEGKVILIPKNFFITLGTSAPTSHIPVNHVNSGLISIKPDGKTGFDACPTVTIEGREYKWRGIKHWVGNPEDLAVPLKSTIAMVSYGRLTEMDLFLSLTQNDNPGYDPSLRGDPNTGQTYPAFHASDDNIFSGIGSGGVTLMGNSNYPLGAGIAVYMINTSRWTSSASSTNSKIVPVLELLE